MSVVRPPFPAELVKVAKRCEHLAATTDIDLRTLASAARNDEMPPLRNAIKDLNSRIAVLARVAQGAERVRDGGMFAPYETHTVRLEGFEFGIAVTRDPYEVEIVTMTIVDWRQALDYVVDAMDGRIHQEIADE